MEKRAAGDDSRLSLLGDESSVLLPRTGWHSGLVGVHLTLLVLQHQ